MKSKKIFVAAVATLVVAAAALCIGICIKMAGIGKMLVLYDGESGKVYEEYEIYEGMEFAVEFIHSVNKSPVKDVFIIKDEKIFVDRTVYSAFGAGVQTEVEEGQTLSYDEKGNMIVSGFDIEFPKIKYIVSTVYDHILYINGETVNLTELCGKNAHVVFEIK